MRKIKYLLFLCAGSLIYLLSFVRLVHAQTIITADSVSGNAIWSAENSPYIIEDQVTIDPSYSLMIGPGTTVIGSSTMEGQDLFRVRGNLSLRGEAEKRVTISGFGGIRVSKGQFSARYSDISLPGGINIYSGSASISSSTVRNAEQGINVLSGAISVSGSRFTDNDYGIFIQSSIPNIFPVLRNDPLFGKGGIGNALSDRLVQMATPSPKPSTVSITNSSLINNQIASIKNDDISRVQAQNNWWGNTSGPSLFGINGIVGAIDYSPWLTLDPESVIPCCSSILFIPGLEGTRLDRPELGFIVNRLWEPNRNADVKKLYLDANGSSTDKTIFSDQPVTRAYGLKDIYGSFMGFLDNIKKTGQINEWKAFGYDWRKPITEVVAGSEKKATTTESLIQVVQDLADRSRTGKVTLIAHSNGGLVAKYLVKTLADLGKENIIDSVISVAVPYLGTPSAISGLLHGDGQTLAKGLFLNQSTARGLATNMASAYSLLPSKRYFSKIFTPTIAFASTTIAGVNDGSYPRNISSYEEQLAYITDSKNTRTNPPASDISLPIEGNNKLMLAADILHGLIDPFSWPASIARWSIVGWNAATVKGLEYFETKECKGKTCLVKPGYATTNSIMGDGTVVAPSAAYDAGQTISLDVANLSKSEKREIAHGNILGASSTAATIGRIVSHNPAEDKRELIDEISKIPGVTIGEPDYSKEPSSLILRTHSPVDIHVYDSEGRHTGIIPTPSGLDEEIEEGFLTFYDEEIPGSSLSRYGGTNENDQDYEVYLRDDSDQKYSIVIDGNGVGTFSFDIKRIQNDSVVDKIEYLNVPVTPLTVATTSVFSGSLNGSFVPLASTSATALNIDIDGNGSRDITVKPQTQYDELAYLEFIKKTLTSLTGNTPRGKLLLKRFDRIADLLKKGKVIQARRVSERLDKRIGHMRLVGLSEKDRKEVINLMELYISQFE
ncbi:MAG: hypothetical protein WCT02_02940 [Candidatus Paceibacterota bacterium]